MKLPSSLKIIWWSILTIFAGWLVYKRLDSISNGTATIFDIFLFAIFVALLLIPIFSKVELFGIKFKQEIAELKKDINIKFGELRNEIHTSQSQTVHNTFQGFGSPPPDNKIPELEKEIAKILSSKLPEPGKETDKKPDHLSVPKGNLDMFKVRYNIETELRRIWQNKNEHEIKLYQPLVRIIKDLTK